ncbi:hypothetical protein MMPV_007833 [Pyropia vietnamensis]
MSISRVAILPVTRLPLAARWRWLCPPPLGAPQPAPHPRWLATTPLSSAAAAVTAPDAPPYQAAAGGTPSPPHGRPSLRVRQTRPGRTTVEAVPSPPPGRALAMYTCGPTVYADAHLGHARTYVTLDILRRVTGGFFGLPLVYTVGVTDVDDKIVTAAAAIDAAAAAAAAKAAGTSFPVPLRGAAADAADAADAAYAADAAAAPPGGGGGTPTAVLLARHYEARFWTDMDALGVAPPSAILRVSAHIPTIIAYIRDLLHAGAAYVPPGGGDGSVYFSVDAAVGGAYGRLETPPSLQQPSAPQPSSPTTAADTSTTATTTITTSAATVPTGKRHPRDFALWKGVPAGEPVGWDSPWGRGRPGWHVECAAMASAYFRAVTPEGGGRLDIHAGGVDIRFPHHENELAAAEAHASAEAHAAAWLLVNSANEKLSKSAGDAGTIREWLAAGGEGGDGHGGTSEERADAFRLFCLTHRWDAPAAWSDDRVRDGLRLLRRLRSFLRAAAATPPSLPLSAGAGAVDGGVVASRRRSGARSDAPHSLPSPPPLDTCTSTDALAVTTATAVAAAAVADRLADSFDTRGAIEALLRLEAAASAAARRADVAAATAVVAAAGGDAADVVRCPPPFPPADLEATAGVRLAVAGAASFIRDITALFGLNARWRPEVGGGGGGTTRDGDGDDSGGGPGGAPTTTADMAIDTLVAFRAAVRGAARRAMAGGGDDHGNGAAAAAALPADLLRLCDEVRDVGLRRGLGVVLRDADSRGGGASTWTRR